MNKSFQEIAGGKLKKFRSLVNGGGLGDLAIYITTAGGWYSLPSGTKQPGETK